MFKTLHITGGQNMNNANVFQAEKTAIKLTAYSAYTICNELQVRLT
jgi:hypothetical protein